MGRSVLGDPTLVGKLAEISEQKTSTTGLIVGSLVDDKYFAVFLAETPKEEDDEDNKTSNSNNLDVVWMAEHAKQVLRLLPGGLTVLGFYVTDNQQFMEKQDGKLRKLISNVGGLDSSVPQEMIILLDQSNVKALDIKSNLFKNLEMKISSSPIDFVRVDTNLILDIPCAIPETGLGLKKEIKSGVSKYRESLENCIFIFDNKIVGNEELLGKPVETEKKKGKGKVNKNEDFDGSELEEGQEIRNVELLFKDRCVPDAQIDESTKVRLKFAGRISSRSYLPPGAKVAWAKEVIVRDLVRSLVTRLEMHTDSVEQESEQDGETNKIVHEPPRRVFVRVGESSVTVSDYLYPGEGIEECINNMKEIFTMEIQEEDVEDDLEIVASPREVKPPGKEDPVIKRRRRIPVGVSVSLGMALISAGIAWFSLGSE